MNEHYDELGIDFQTDFYDYGGHVNALGAEKCTSFLEQYLLKHYQWTDRRDQMGYDSWQQSFYLWQKEQEKAKKVIEKRITDKDYAEIEEE